MEFSSRSQRVTRLLIGSKPYADVRMDFETYRFINVLHMNNKILLWQDINWSLVEFRIDRLQKRIYKYSLAGNKGRVTFLQNLLINSLDAKLLAVRKVTTDNQGRKTAGVDGTTCTTPEQKMNLVEKLSVDGKAAPSLFRRVWIPKPGKSEKLPLGIPMGDCFAIIRDRAKQKLVLMALEPEWEAHFEPNSYGFRPGRSTQDAIEAIFLMLRKTSTEFSGKYVFDADLKGCFDNINHDYLLKTLNTSPRITTQVQAWLKAGIFEGIRLDPPYLGVASHASRPPKGGKEENQIGTPQGAIISPFLANVALHGMENFIKNWICDQVWPYKSKHESYKTNKKKSIGLVRYADDFVIIHRDPQVLANAKTALAQWLANTSQLKYNESKSKIVHSSLGFNFLGFSIINIVRNGVTRLKIYPSSNNQEKLIKEVGDRCRKYRSISAFELINSLRPKILGWGNYFKYCECKEVFAKLDRSIFQILRSWVFRRDKRHGRNIVKEKYFPSGRSYTFQGRNYQNNWILNGQTKEKGGTTKDNYLPKLSWIGSEKYVKVKSSASVYADDAYWALRGNKYGNFDTRQRKLLKIQKGLCTICKHHIKDSAIEVDHIIPRALGGKDNYTNWQLVHKHCHVLKTQQDRKNISVLKSRAG